MLVPLTIKDINLKALGKLTNETRLLLQLSGTRTIYTYDLVLERHHHCHD
jgi:hypothetical protein